MESIFNEYTYLKSEVFGDLVKLILEYNEFIKIGKDVNLINYEKYNLESLNVFSLSAKKKVDRKLKQRIRTKLNNEKRKEK